MTIKELRKEKGLTLAEFAKALGIGLSTLTGYEAVIEETARIAEEEMLRENVEPFEE